MWKRKLNISQPQWTHLNWFHLTRDWIWTICLRQRRWELWNNSAPHGHYLSYVWFPIFYYPLRVFPIIAMNLFLQILWQEHKRETRFTSQCPPKEIITKIAEAARPLGFDIQKKNYKVYCLLLTCALLQSNHLCKCCHICRRCQEIKPFLLHSVLQFLKCLSLCFMLFPDADGEPQSR